jgi:hypothetical protein
MSCKDARTKQSQDYRDRFDHLTHPDALLLRVLGNAGFRVASSGPENGFRSGWPGKNRAFAAFCACSAGARGFGLQSRAGRAREKAERSSFLRAAFHF